MTAFEPYLPANVLKPFADGIWIVGGPEIRMDYGPVALPFPTRMVVVRLKPGHLWLPLADRARRSSWRMAARFRTMAQRSSHERFDGRFRLQRA